MNGLKTVWIISRHYRSENKMEELISKITNEICDKVENNIKIADLFKMDKFPYDIYLTNSSELIK